MKVYNIKNVWHGVKLLRGYESKRWKLFANKKKNLWNFNGKNVLYNRFNRHDSWKWVDYVRSNAFGNNWRFVCTNEQNRKEFKRLRPSKAAGQDGISPKEIGMLSNQLWEIFCTIINLSFKCSVVPDISKCPCTVPVHMKNKWVETGRIDLCCFYNLWTKRATTTYVIHSRFIGSIPICIFTNVTR